MSYKEFKKIGYEIINNISLQDFFEIGEIMHYDDNYIKKCYTQFNNDRFHFLLLHDMGEHIVNLSIHKLSLKKLLQTTF